MPSETDIVNAALRMVGANRIATIGEDSKEGLVAADLYEPVRDDLLRRHNWNFATRRAQLARNSTTPTFEFDYAYTLPAGWLRTVSVHDNDEGVGTIEYREEEVDNTGVLLAHSEEVYIRFVARVTDPNRMPADFRRAWTLGLARDFAIPLANSNPLHEKFSTDYDKAVIRAAAADARGSTPERRPAGSWVSARGGWRR